MFARPVPCVVETELLCQNVDRVLAGTDLFSWKPHCVEDLADDTEKAGVVVLERALLFQRSFRKGLIGLRPTLPDLRAILLSEHPESHPRPMPYPRCEICVVAADLPTLPTRIAWARFYAWKAGIRRQIRSVTHFPFPLREVLVAALHQRIPFCGENERTIRTVTAAARSVGVSREHLSRTAGSGEVDLASYLDACNALNALAEVKIEDRSWSEIAIRMGYSSQSGLTRLVKRGLGMTPTVANSGALGEWVGWWEHQVLEPLLAREVEDHTEWSSVTHRQTRAH